MLQRGHDEIEELTATGEMLGWRGFFDSIFELVDSHVGQAPHVAWNILSFNLLFSRLA